MADDPTLEITIRADSSQAEEALGGLAEQTEQLGESGEAAEKGLSALASSLLSIDVLARAFDWLTEQIGDVMALADAWSNLNATLDLATESQSEAAAALAEVQAIAQETAGDLSAVGDLYATLTRALDSLGDSTTNVADLTRTIAQAFAVSGASSAEAAGTITQLAQALASGQLRGDEFNSVMEQAPRLSLALADALGVTTGELRAMAEEGELTAQTVIGALRDQASQVAAEAATLPDTFERATQRLKNSLTAIVGGLNEALHASELYAAGAGLLGQAIGALASVLETIGAVLVRVASLFSAIPAPVAAAAAAMVATGVAAVALATHLGAITAALASMATGLTLVAFAALASFAAQVRAAIAVVQALWAVLLANPLTALAGLFAMVVAGVLAYRAANAETVASLQATRDELQAQADEVAALRDTLKTAEPDTDAYRDASQRLAQLVPGLTLDLDEQGRVVAHLGEQYAANAAKVEDFRQALITDDLNALARQLVLAAAAQDDAATAADQHAQRMREQYGESEATRTGMQRLTLWLGHLGDAFAANQAETDALSQALRGADAALRALAIEALDAGLSVEQITTRLRDLGYSEAQIARVTTAMQALTETADQGLTGLTRGQQAVAQAAGEASAKLQGTLKAVSAEIKRLDEEIETHRKTLKTALDAETASWRALGDEAKRAYAGQIAEIERVTAAQRQAIDTNLTDERTAATQRAQLLRTETAERLAATRQYQSEALFLIQQEYDRRKTAARAAGADEAVINQEYLRARRATLDEVAAAYRAHIDTLNREAQRHLDAVRRIEDEIASLKLSTEDRIRELQRGGMSEYEAYQDRKRQAAEKLAASERALAQSSFEEAQTLAKQAADLYAQNARAIVEGDRELVTQKQATAEAVRGVGAAAALETRALEGMQAAHQSQADAAQGAATETETALQAVSTQIDDLAARLDKDLILKIQIDSAAVTAAIDTIQPLLDSRQYLVTIQGQLTALDAVLDQAQDRLQERPLTIDLALAGAQAALDDLKTYAETKARPELKLSVEQALAEVDKVEGAIRQLDGAETASAHAVETNAADALAEIRTLDGADTSSTHTIYVKKVETNATGGVVGRYASGGSVFPRPAWSRVPGVGNHDSVPAALPTGAYVLRQAAARYYGPLLARLNAGGLVNTLLTPGERWFNPATVARHGTGFFDALNQMALPRETLAAHLDGLLSPVRRFAAGGMVGARPAASGGARDSIDINLQVGARTVQLQGARDQAQALADALREWQRGL